MTNPIIHPYYNSKGKKDTSQTGLPVYALDITDKLGFPIYVVKDKYAGTSIKVVLTIK